MLPARPWARLRPFLAVVALIPAAAAVAPARAGDLSVEGTVGLRCFLEIQNQNVTLDIVKGTPQVTVAMVGEWCNAPNGYRLIAESRNGGRLGSDNGTSVEYRWGHPRWGSNLSLREPVRTFSSYPQTRTRWSPFSISIPATPTALVGTYTDTITLTISAR